jgi:hypothetical protein
VDAQGGCSSRMPTMQVKEVEPMNLEYVTDFVKENSNIVMAAIHILIAFYIYKDGILFGYNVPMYAVIIAIGISYYIFHILREDVGIIQNKLFEAQKKNAVVDKAKKNNMSSDLLMMER